MSIPTILPLVGAVLTLILGIFAVYKKRNLVNSSFFLFCLVTFIWLFSTFMMFIVQDTSDAKAIFWDKVVYCGVVFMPVFAYQFGLALTKGLTTKKKIVLVLGYVIAIFFLGTLIFTDLFIADLFRYKWAVHSKARLFHHFFLLFFTVYFLLFWFRLMQRSKETSNKREKLQIRYIFVAILLLIGIGSIAYLPAYGVGIYPFAYISGVLYAVIVAYAIITQQLMDIKLVVRKTSVYTFSIVTVIIPVFILRIFTVENLTRIYLLTDFFILVIVLAVFPAIKRFYFNIANKYFFYSFYDSRQVISNVNEKIRSTLDINEIYDYICKTLKDAFQSKTIAILIADKENQWYHAQKNIGFDFGSSGGIVWDKNLYESFIHKDELMVIEDLSANGFKEKSEETLEKFRKIGVDVVAPLNVGEQNMGLLLVGSKESEDMYNEEDFQVLDLVGTQAAIAIKNALLYKETQDFNIKLQREVKKATTELEVAYAELKQVDDAKSEFISMASHQLRTPISITRGYISMLVDGDFGQLQEDQKKYVSKVGDNLSRLNVIVNDILNSSRIEGGRFHINSESTEIVTIIKRAADEIVYKAEQKGVELQVTIPPALETLRLNLDKEKIYEVISNLIDNAICYTPEGFVGVKFEELPDHYVIYVSDSGIGIPADKIDSLFSRFTRLENAKKMRPDGTGIGLYLAKIIVEGHEGEIGVESELNKGSTFFVKLPKKLKIKEEAAQ